MEMHVLRGEMSTGHEVPRLLGVWRRLMVFFSRHGHRIKGIRFLLLFIFLYRVSSFSTSGHSELFLMIWSQSNPSVHCKVCKSNAAESSGLAYSLLLGTPVSLLKLLYVKYYKVIPCKQSSMRYSQFPTSFFFVTSKFYFDLCILFARDEWSKEGRVPFSFSRGNWCIIMQIGR